MIGPQRMEQRARRETHMVEEKDLPEARAFARRMVAERPIPRKHLKTYAMFVGYARSGHSLLGSWLDAHPDMIFAHELHVLWLLQEGFTRDEIYQLLLENSRLFATFGRQWGEYSYGVDGQWQGRFRRLQVIGDKKGSGSTRLLATNPELLDQVLAFEADVRIVHVVRNPFDVIATGWRKSRRFDVSLPPPAHRVRDQFALCAENEALRSRVAPGTMIDVRHEDLIGRPRRTLRQVCEFLGVEVTRDYLDACASIAFESAKKSRHAVRWDPEVKAMVQDGIARFDFLAGYSFES